MQVVPCLLLFLLQYTISIADPVIQLPNGLIRGRKDVTIQNKTYYAFEKIPYAKPPVGQLRFKPPQPSANWEGVLNTTHNNVSCYQGAALGTVSENCLFINVYTPKLPVIDDDEDLLPVMLFIYGGGFMSGSNAKYRSEWFVDSGVILVTINYRLGIFGFLSTQDEVIPGNNGLKDQLLALRWSHDNINLFGGDPEKITIFGQSSGAASVGYQLMNLKSQGLYSGAILESGSSLMPGAYQRNARKIAFAVASLLNETFATNNDSSALLQFLLTVDAEKIQTAVGDYQKAHSGPQMLGINHGLFWAPVIEVDNPDAFITEKMYGKLENGEVVLVPILIGINSEEAVGWDEDNLKSFLSYYDEHLEWLVPADMRITDEEKRRETGKSIREIYTDGEPLLEHLGAGVRFLSDTGIGRSSIKFAELFSKSASTRFYQFSYNGKLGGNEKHYDGADYVGHNEELYYIFCLAGCDISSYPEGDQITSKRLLKLWTNFAKYRNPTPGPSELLQNITWPEFGTDFLYLNINETLEIKSHPKQEMYSKWVTLYDSLGFTDYDTY